MKYTKLYTTLLIWQVLVLITAKKQCDSRDQATGYNLENIVKMAPDCCEMPIPNLSKLKCQDTDLICRWTCIYRKEGIFKKVGHPNLVHVRSMYQKLYPSSAEYSYADLFVTGFKLCHRELSDKQTISQVSSSQQCDRTAITYNLCAESMAHLLCPASLIVNDTLCDEFREYSANCLLIH